MASAKKLAGNIQAATKAKKADKQVKAGTPAGSKAGSRKPAGSRSAPSSPSAAKLAGSKSAPEKPATVKTADPEKYTDPQLRERIKQRILEGDKGGRTGQWSARKAQMVAHEYEAEGGGFTGKRDEAQQSLTHWGEEHWTTSDGQPANREDGMHRYLPEDAWNKLSPAEKKATNKKKLAGDKQGNQFVANTQSAVKARKAAEK